MTCPKIFIGAGMPQLSSPPKSETSVEHVGQYLVAIGLCERVADDGGDHHGERAWITDHAQDAGGDSLLTALGPLLRQPASGSRQMRKNKTAVNLFLLLENSDGFVGLVVRVKAHQKERLLACCELDPR